MLSGLPPTSRNRKIDFAFFALSLKAFFVKAVFIFTLAVREKQFTSPEIDELEMIAMRETVECVEECIKHGGKGIGAMIPMALFLRGILSKAIRMIWASKEIEFEGGKTRVEMVSTLVRGIRVSAERSSTRLC
jgi:hypothetical protein